MKRLTYKNKSMERFEVMENIDTNYLEIRRLENGVDTLYTGKIINKLADYEETGLSPDEIEKLVEQVENQNEKIKQMQKDLKRDVRELEYDLLTVEETKDKEIAKLKANFDEQAVHLQEEKQTAIKKFASEIKLEMFTDPTILEDYQAVIEIINNLLEKRGIKCKELEENHGK